MAKLPQRVKDNAQKLVYLKTQYPDDLLPELLARVQMPPIDINIALWYAIEQGWFAKPDADKQTVELLKIPASWEFGEFIDDLQDMIIYAFGKLAENETDLDEEYLTGIESWLDGYAAHDRKVAVLHLVQTHKLAQYEIEDGASKYIFYTLYKNREHLWGRKQFKNDPLAVDERKKKDE